MIYVFKMKLRRKNERGWFVGNKRKKKLKANLMRFDYRNMCIGKFEKLAFSTVFLFHWERTLERTFSRKSESWISTIPSLITLFRVLKCCTTVGWCNFNLNNNEKSTTISRLFLMIITFLEKTQHFPTTSHDTKYLCHWNC